MWFLLWLRLFILSGVISPLISSSILGTYWPGEFIFQCCIFLPFHAVHGVLKARILKWFAIPFSSGPYFVRTLHHDPSVLGGPTWPTWLIVFIELDKAVVHVIRLVSFLWLWFSFCLPSDGEGWGLWKLRDGRDWLRGKLGLVLMGRVHAQYIYSVNFLSMGGAVFPPCYLTWGQTVVEVMKIMVTFFKRSHAYTATLSAPNSAVGHRQLTPPLETPEHSRARLGQSLMGSLLLSPGSWCTRGSVCVLRKSVSQSCVHSGGSLVGLMVTSSKRAYAIPRSAAPRASVPATGHCWPVPPQETVTHSSVSVSVASLGPEMPNPHRVWF